MKRRRQWHPTPVLLPGKSRGWRSLVGCSPWGLWGSDTTERLHFHFSLSYIGEGNGNPLQCSCLENSRDGEAWWAAVYGVAQSRTRLKRLSSSRTMKTFSRRTDLFFCFATTVPPLLFQYLPPSVANPCLCMPVSTIGLWVPWKQESLLLHAFICFWPCWAFL